LAAAVAAEVVLVAAEVVVAVVAVEAAPKLSIKNIRETKRLNTTIKLTVKLNIKNAF
jgi:hypothetical protein